MRIQYACAHVVYPCNGGIRRNAAVDKSFRSNRDSCSDGNQRISTPRIECKIGGKKLRSKFWIVAFDWHDVETTFNFFLNISTNYFLEIRNIR